MIIAKELIINAFNHHRVASDGDINTATRLVAQQLGVDEATILAVVIESLQVSALPLAA